MSDPWKCPDCQEWQGPQVSSHRCAEKAGGESTKETPPGYSGHQGGSFERSGATAGWRPLGFGLRP